MAKAHVNRQGDSCSRVLMREGTELGHWAEVHLLSLQAEHISGISNTHADWLNRITLDSAEWQLLPEIFLQIKTIFECPQVDLFASPTNTQLLHFFTRYWTPGAMGTDAFCCQWSPALLYAFLPIPLISRVLRRILQEGADVIFIAPYWPQRSWFADLLSLSWTPLRIAPDQVSLHQGAFYHPNP